MGQLFLTRHTQSTFNAERRYTGEIDAPLTDQGREEARQLGLRLLDVRFDRAYTSALSRAHDTLMLILIASGQTSVPVVRTPLLNECDHGSLQGHNREESIVLFGEEVVQAWRTRFDAVPPGGESLADCAARSWPYFQQTIMRDAQDGKNVLVVAHGRKLQGLIGRLNGLTPEETMALKVSGGAIHRFVFSEALEHTLLTQ
jgi:2,3-bisphosphoglycerate-dependent phosphoglycerate mutase